MLNRHASLPGENQVDTTPEGVRLAELVLKAAVPWHQAHVGKTFSQVTVKDAELTEALSPKEEQILNGLDAIGSANPATLANYCRIPLPTLQRILRSLLKRGLITKEGQTRGVSYTLPKHKKCYG